MAVVSASTAVGIGLGFTADPLLAWMESVLGDAPVPLRIAARIPVSVVVAALALAGLFAGLALVGEWEKETLVMEVSPDGVRGRQHKRSRWVDRSQVSRLYLDGDELVMADDAGRTVMVGSVVGVSKRKLSAAFADSGWPRPHKDNPFENRFRVFVEGRDDLGDPANGLLADRAAARADKDAERARELRCELSKAGVLIRDRKDEQEYVVLTGTGDEDARHL